MKLGTKLVLVFAIIGAVYISTNKELRWSYYANRGQLPNELGVVFARFATKLADLRNHFQAGAAHR